MHYYFITGASKGLGLAITTQLSTHDNIQILAFSRQITPELQALTLNFPDCITYYPIDLSQTSASSDLVDQLLNSLNLLPDDHISLINNAGSIEPIALLGSASVPVSSYEANIALNLTTPIALSGVFIKNTSAIQCDRKIINISSGAGKNPISGWSSYCASKAGIDMMTRVIALEQKDSGVKCISFGPGIMDTDMQATIRSSSAEDFERLDQFKQFKEDGKLLSPECVAQVVIDLLTERHPFEQGSLVSVQDYL